MKWKVKMTDNTAFVVIVVAILATIALCNYNGPTDPITERIKAIDDAIWGLSDASKERVLIEALRGNTNSIKAILETPLERPL